MASKRTSTVEVPGDPATPEADATAPDAPNPLAPAVDLQPATLADSASADQDKALELSRQVGVLNDARTGKVTLIGGPALDHSHLTNPAAIMAKIGADPEAHLPNPDDVDWEKIEGDRVLTKQGWLLRR